MNIFALSYEPVEAAQMIGDGHVSKMVLETAQILCSARHKLGDTTPIKYKPTHKNHPCVVWAAHSLQNFDWLCRYGLALSAEYTMRYGRTHKSEAVIREAIKFFPQELFAHYGMTPFAQSFGDNREDYISDCPVSSYRLYYQAEKLPQATYTHGRSAPKWLEVKA